MKIIEMTDFRSKHKVLVEPMSKKELKENIRKNGRISAKVLLHFDDIVNNDIEWLNDMASEKITKSICGLMDINYSVVGRTIKNDLILKVDAEVEFDNI